MVCLQWWIKSILSPFVHPATCGTIKHLLIWSLPVKGAVALKQKRKKFEWWKSWIFSSVQAQAEMSKHKLKHQSASRNVKGRAEMSKHELKPQSASQNFQARAKTSKLEPKHQSVSRNVKAWAKTLKHEPKRQSANQNVEARAKIVKCDQNQWNAS